MPAIDRTAQNLRYKIRLDHLDPALAEEHAEARKMLVDVERRIHALAEQQAEVQAINRLFGQYGMIAVRKEITQEAPKNRPWGSSTAGEPWVYVVATDVSFERDGNPASYIGEKTLNLLLQGKLLTDEQKQVLVQRMLPGIVNETKATEESSL